MPVVELPYDDARGEIRQGDLLLWRPTSLMGRLICWGGGAYSHASMAGWSNEGHLRNVEMVQWHGGRTVLLSQQVRRWPGVCEVWRPIDSGYDGEAALRQMLWLCGQHYGWSDLFLIAAHQLCPRIILPIPMNSNDPDVPRVCSVAVAFAMRSGTGVIACPGKPDALVKPSDLANERCAKYLFTPVFMPD